MQTRSASMVLLVFLLFVPICLQPAWTAESENVYAIDPNDPVALQEATRILAEEVKLAARPQTYIIVDLVDRSLVIKGRGAELHRLPIQQWSAVHLAEATATFRLQARPPVSRRKVEPLAAGDQPPVSLDDMPIDFTLKFSPSFIMVVHPSASDDFWRWLRVTGREWWMWMKEWAWRLSTGYEPAVYPILHLTLTPHHAQSLAWTVTQGMPLLVRRASPPTS